MRVTAVSVAITLVALSLSACGGDKHARAGAPANSTPAATVTVVASSPAAAWKSYSADGASISLPPEFVGGEFDAAGETAAAITALGPKCEQSMDAIRRLQSALAFIAVDSRRCESTDFVTNVLITQHDWAGGPSALDYLDAVERLLPRAFDVREKQSVSLGENTVAQMIVHGNLGPGAEFDQAYYAIPGDGVMWSIVCSDGPDGFDADRATFDQIAASFRLP